MSNELKPDDDTSAASVEPPKSTSGDFLHAVVKAGLSALPGIGGPAAELFQLVIAPPIEDRRIRWVEMVGKKLMELEQRGIDLGSLAKNEEFITVVLHASTVAIRTHQREKLEALRNAVANVAVGLAPDETLQAMLIRLVDELTPMHLKLLSAAHLPEPLGRIPITPGQSGIDRFAMANVTELVGREALLNQIWDDLFRSGLVNTERVDGLFAIGSTAGSGSATTFLGSALLNFIHTPP